MEIEYWTSVKYLELYLDIKLHCWTVIFGSHLVVKVQKMATRGFQGNFVKQATGAMRSTSTDALEVTLGIVALAVLGLNTFSYV